MRRLFLPLLMTGTLLFLFGCGKDVATPKNTGPGKSTIPTSAEVAKKPHDHSGWWCDEHGIPEHECSMCSDSFAKECKKKGDWCDKHDRAKSQCFICDPKLKEQFAAKYRAKFGQEPPRIPEE